MNVLVIALLAIIVLLSVIGLFFSSWLSDSQTINLQSVKTDSCKLLRGNCKRMLNELEIDNFDADKDGEIDPGFAIGDCSEKGGTAKDNLYMLCKCYYMLDEDTCRNDLCMCSAVVTGGEEMPPAPPEPPLPP